MFRQIVSQNATALPTAAQEILKAHPARLLALLEAYWDKVAKITPPPPPPLAFPEGLQNVTGAFPAAILNPLAPVLPPPPVPQPLPQRFWDHLIYAYMMENTRVYEIFQRVIDGYAHGERFGVATAEAQAWLRATEELFYRPSPPFSIAPTTSDIRPDGRAARRNAYFRMFGLDLNHGGPDSRAYPYQKPEAANRDFVPTLERFGGEVWRAVVNFQNTSGKRDTDDEAIFALCDRLRDMLTLRRRHGNLTREEFWYTSMMSWFELTLAADTPIIVALDAQATSEDDRLAKVGARVGLPAHGKTRAFMQLARELSPLLIGIEIGAYDSLTNAQTLYMNPGTREMMQRIITQYSVATGRDIKAAAVAVGETRR